MKVGASGLLERAAYNRVVFGPRGTQKRALAAFFLIAARDVDRPHRERVQPGMELQVEAVPGVG